MSENDKAIGSGVQLILEELALATGKAVLADLDATRAALAAEKARADRAISDSIAIAKGCVDYSGGHRGELLEAYHHGIRTVEAALTAYRDRGLADMQTATLHRIGSAALEQAAPKAGEVNPNERG